MAKKDTKFKKGEGGRPTGAKNKVTKSVKEALKVAFDELQKDEDNNLISFAKRYPRDFYNLAAKLIPTEIQGKVDQNYTIEYKVIDNETGDELKSIE